MARDPEGGAANIRSSIAKAAAFLGYELKNEQEESVFQFASGKYIFVCLPTDSVDIKYAICGRINCNERLYGLWKTLPSACW